MSEVLIKILEKVSNYILVLTGLLIVYKYFKNKIIKDDHKNLEKETEKTIGDMTKEADKNIDLNDTLKRLEDGKF